MTTIKTGIQCTKCGKDILYCNCENSPKTKIAELEQENAELKVDLETAQDCIVQQQKEYEKLDKQYTEWFCKYHKQIITVSEQKKQIEKMRCCGNCKHYGQICETVDIESFTGKLCDNWELADEN